MNRLTPIEDLMLICNRCGHHCANGRELIAHKWKKHAVRPLSDQAIVNRTPLAFAGVGGERRTAQDFRIRS